MFSFLIKSGKLEMKYNDTVMTMIIIIQHDYATWKSIKHDSVRSVIIINKPPIQRNIITMERLLLMMRGESHSDHYFSNAVCVCERLFTQVPSPDESLCITSLFPFLQKES